MNMLPNTEFAEAASTLPTAINTETDNNEARILAARTLSFVRNAANNGNDGLGLLLDMVARWERCGDWRPLAALIGAVAESDARKLRELTGMLVTGWKIVGKGKATKFAKLEPKDGEAVPRGFVDRSWLQAACEDGASFRAVGKAKAQKAPENAADKAARSIAADMAKLARKCIRQGMSDSEAKAAFSAALREALAVN